MTPKLSQRLALVQSALTQSAFDMIIHNVRIVNVYDRSVSPGGIAVKNGRIATLAANQDLEAAEKFDAKGMYALPGLIDTHVHIDSTLLTPEGLAELIVPHGTTAMFVDAMEIANVAGINGLRALFDSVSQLPYHIYLEIPSRVPTAPGLETTGGVLDLNDVRELLQWDRTISLGELDPSKVLGLKEEYFMKIEAAHSLGKIANGHAIGLTATDLDAYACAGLADDHECVTFAQAKERIQRGLSVLIREGSSERNLAELVRGILTDQVDTRHYMFCTDDKHPNEILREGHINFMVNQAIRMGMPATQAIQMASLNAAQHFRLEYELGSLTPGRWADIILCENLDEIHPEYVFSKGNLSAEKGNLVKKPQKAAYPSSLYHTVKALRGKGPVDFRFESKASSVKVRVIELIENQIINREINATLPVQDGCIQNDTENDILKLAVVERYGKNGNIGLGFVHGFGIQRGAIASSVSHDHHNIVIAGADDESMATCVRAIEEMQGGLVCALGNQVLHQLALPLGGLMSELPSFEIIRQLDLMNSEAATLGCKLAAPFMTLSFISLPTVPELGITDMGLIDVSRHCIISAIND